MRPLVIISLVWALVLSFHLGLVQFSRAPVLFDLFRIVNFGSPVLMPVEPHYLSYFVDFVYDRRAGRK
jgi:hypothetical protein